MLWCCCLKKWSFFPPSFHCFSSSPCLYHSCQTGFETSLVENEALDLLPVIILPDQLPALTISVDRLGNSGTTIKWEHYVRISPVCKSQGQHGVAKHRGSTGLSRQRGGHAETLSLAPLLLPYPCCPWGLLLPDVCCSCGGLGWRGSSFLQHIRCAYGNQQALGMEHYLSVQQTPWSLHILAPWGSSKYWSNGAELRYTSWWIRVPKVFSLLVVCPCLP